MEPIIATTDDLQAALNRISFVNTVLDFKWKFEFEPFRLKEKYGWFLWVSFERPDTLTGVVGRGRGRDEIVWGGASLSSAVKTAWVCFEMVLKHEAMEGFRVDGRRPFNPHAKISDLIEIDTLGR